MNLRPNENVLRDPSTEAPGLLPRAFWDGEWGMNDPSLNTWGQFGFPPCLENAENLTRRFCLCTFGWCLSCSWQSVMVPTGAPLMSRDCFEWIHKVASACGPFSTLEGDPNILVCSAGIIHQIHCVVIIPAVLWNCLRQITLWLWYSLCAPLFLVFVAFILMYEPMASWSVLITSVESTSCVLFPHLHVHTGSPASPPDNFHLGSSS